VSSHYEEEAEVEELRRWWRENWMALALGVALGLAAIFGWQAWNTHKDTHAVQAAQMFDDLKQALAQHKDSDADAIGKKLLGDFADTPYAADAQLLLAQNAFQALRYDEARERLQWIKDHSKDAGLVDIARLRLARVYWEMAKYDDALAQLSGNQPAFDGLYAELRGDILLARGDRAGARAAYAAALNHLGDKIDRTSLQKKYDALADVGGTHS
jgi:predicted negative regulator of RcsB-dependent stress response